MIDPQDVLDGPAATGSEVFDCVIVGGGPAGLTAGLYLRRFDRRVRIIDAGAGRARLISRSHNIAGFPLSTRSQWPWAMRPLPPRLSTTAFDAMDISAFPFDLDARSMGRCASKVKTVSDDHRAVSARERPDPEVGFSPVPPDRRHPGDMTRGSQ